MSESCATCSRFLKCTRPQRGFETCDKYKPWTAQQSELLTSFLGENVSLDDLDKDSVESERAQEASLMTQLSEAMSPRNVIPPDLKINDQDLKQYPNFYEFCMDPKGLNQAPLPRQLAIFTHLFAEYCPHCSSDIFRTIYDFPVDYPIADAKEDVTFLEFGVCPKCNARKTELIREGDLNNYTELALCCGQRSGKSIGTSLANAYITHRYLKLQNPGKVFGQTSNTKFTGTFVGLTFGKAKSLLFEPLIDLMDKSPWFQAYHELLDDAQERYGEEIYVYGKEMVFYKHRGIALYPASPNKRILRGDTRILTGVDELGWFPFGEDSNDRERAGADEVYEALDRSMLTVREASEQLIDKGYDNVPTAYGIYASSPSAYNDKIMSLVRAFKGSDLALAAHFATWEMNPKIKRTSRSIAKAYLENPVKADRDYGANPPLADSAFIADPTEFQECFTKRPNLLGAYKYTVITRNSGKELRSGKFTKDLVHKSGACVMGIDAGAANNSFGITLAREMEGVPQILGMMELAPDHKRPLDFAALYRNILLPIVKTYNVVKVYVDRWQSLKIIQDIEADTEDLPYAVSGEQYTLRLNDFEFVLDYMRDPKRTPQFPKLEDDWQSVFTRSNENYPHSFAFEPVSHFLFQMATVRQTRNNIDKGQGYTDDVFRSVFLCLTNLYDDDVVEELRNFTFTPQAAKTKSLIAVSGNTGSGASGVSATTSSRAIVVGRRGF